MSSRGESVEKFRSLSPAEFFYRNREIAGFSNPSRALYQTVRELVENSLDACDNHGILPTVRITIFPENTKENHYRVTVSDNGIGIPPRYVPQAFGKVLFGSKYKLRQTRGTFGLGAKMAILYGQITTGKPVEVRTSPKGSQYSYFFKIMIDIEKNEPIVMERRIMKRKSKRHGTTVSVVVEGDWSRARSRILEYIKRTAMGIPYATITIITPEKEAYKYSRVIRKMPPPPREVKPHPRGVDIEMLKAIIASTKSSTLKDMLKNAFQSIGKKSAEILLEEAGIDPNKDPRKLTLDEITALVSSMRKYNKYRPPRTDALSPLGKDIIEAGLKGVLKPEFAYAVTRKPSSYSGHPFIVEVGVAYGGEVPLSPDKGPILYRFANKIPLLYDEGSDVCWKVVSDANFNWRQYNVKLPDRIAVLVHICSTKIPYKGVGKESIADVPEIEREVRNAVKEAARHLRLYLSKKIRAEEEKRKIMTLVKYVPEVARSLSILSKPPASDGNPVDYESIKSVLMKIIERRARKIDGLNIDLRELIIDVG